MLSQSEHEVMQWTVILIPRGGGMANVSSREGQGLFIGAFVHQIFIKPLLNQRASH